MSIDFYSVTTSHRVKETSTFLKNRLTIEPEVAIVLGSGLSIVGEKIKNRVTISYTKIPNFPLPTVSGHPGEIVTGEMNGVPVIAFMGRVHYYEGKKLEEIVFPTIIMSELGVKKIIITNAAGAVNRKLKVGDLVLLERFINFAQVDIFIDKWDEKIEIPFSVSYHSKIQKLESFYPGRIHRGVYCWTTGPTYETPAEVKLIEYLGGDVVGMSTLPEVMMAKRLGIEVIGISFVSNPAAGISQTPLSHEEVKKAAAKYKDSFCFIIEKSIKVISTGKTAL